MTNIEILRDRIAGALYGVAVGDALGGPLEFMQPDLILKKYGGPVDTMVGGGWLNLAPGETTDDTAMTLAVAEGIMEQPDNPCEAIGRRFVAWAKSGPKDIGGTCAAAIRRATAKAQELHLEHPDVVCWNYAGRAVAETSRGRNAGNGALMRAVYPALYYHDVDRAVQETINQGNMTHWNQESRDACNLYARVLNYFLEAAAIGHTGDEYEDAKAYRVQIAARAYDYDLDAIEERGNRDILTPTGYVVDSLECALYAWWTNGTFRGAITTAVNMGGDADTIGAICGGLCGAHRGFNEIPAEWIAYLSTADRERLNAAVAAAVENWKGVL